VGAEAKTYFTEEYEAIIEYNKPTKKSFESINTITEEDAAAAQDINNEQLQQMATPFKGATDVASEVMDSIKTAMDEIVKLNQTVANLTQTNKTLVETIATMGGARKTDTKESQERTSAGSGKCPHCNNFHNAQRVGVKKIAGMMGTGVINE
jgi:DNA anti-recombination protein RmuC